ncbi:helix-turn-helix domain-containing protein [Paenibacillus macerans]|uniref:helix-turn-helix domain-containing protein n=1 Tax=Paenibacillus macerans TaxID=44252 RepID=UPI001BCD4C83|nr:helix-turn-helix domain-containing protein [Paenibacillus macerans]
MKMGKGRYYRKNLILMLVVSAIPGIITGVLVYGMIGGRLENELLQMHHRQIEQRARNIDEQLANLELMLSHWAFDPKFDYSLNGLDFTIDFERARDITKTLVVMQGSNTMIKQVELYLGGNEPILFDPEYGEIKSAAVTGLYDKLVGTRQSTYWTEWAFDPSRPGEKELTLVHHIPGGSQEPFGALLIRMDTGKVADMLKTMTPYNVGETFLAQTTGGLFASAGGSAPDSPFVKRLRTEIRERGSADKASFVFEWEGKTYAVTYGAFSRIANEWVYVSASPISSITAPVMFVSKLIFIVSFSALVLAALLSWLASRRMYSPIRRLFKTLLPEHAAVEGQEDDEFALIERQWLNLHWESHDLQRKLAEQLPHVKESFLHQLLHGHLYAYSEQELRGRMERFKWEVENRRFVLLYVQLTGITSLGGKFKNGDEGLVSYAAANIISELAAQRFSQCDTIHFHNLSTGIVLLVPNETSYMPEVQAFSEELIRTVNLFLKMRVTVAVSRAVTQVTDIPFAFEGVRQAASYRPFDGENQIIEMEKLDREGAEEGEPAYSFTLERELIQAMRTGQEEDAYRLLGEFLAALSARGAKTIDVQQGMLQLLGHIQHAIMQSGIHPNRLFKGVNLYEALSQIREPELILTWFREKVLAPYLKELSLRANAGVKLLIEQAMIYLQQNYMKDISLDSCADHVGTNPFFLSKSFKQVTGHNFIDYLTELRMEKAKELLRDTGLRICDVAQQVGYQHSYFNRIFKKLEGMTPTRYRELSQ